MRARREKNRNQPWQDTLILEDATTCHELRVDVERGTRAVLIRDDETGACVWIKGSDAETLGKWLLEDWPVPEGKGVFELWQTRKEGSE